MLKYKYPTMTQTQLGQLFGATSHEIGRWLTDVGLRDDNRPTPRAFDGDFCVAVPSRGQGYHYAWKAEKTVPLLDQAGHHLAFPLPGDLVDTPVLNGPFSHRRRASGGYEIVNGDGTVGVLVDGVATAVWLERILNKAAKVGLFRPKVPGQPGATV